MNLLHLIANKKTAMLEWVEPLYGVDEHGLPVTGCTTLSATVEDCIAATRLQYQHHPFRDTIEISEEDMLLDFIAVHWAEFKVPSSLVAVTPELPAGRDAPSWWERFVGWRRLRRGYCPACNFDAPEVDTCEVCHFGVFITRSLTYPMSGSIRQELWRRFKLGKLKHDTTNYRTAAAGARAQDRP